MALEKELREVKRANEILKAASAFFARELDPRLPKLVSFVTGNSERWGVESICTELKIAPATYYAATTRPLSKRAEHDEVFKEVIERIHRKNRGVYGVQKVWRQMLREGWKIGRDRVARLMRALGLEGVVRGKRKRTTVPGELAQRPGDLVDRVFSASAPNRLWVADITYVSTWEGFVYVAFITDVYSRMIVGWKVSRSLSADLALDALEMALWRRRHDDLSRLVHHSDRGVQYLAIRYTDRLDAVAAMRSVGTKGDSYDNALAESVNGLYKTELIRRASSWREAETVEVETGEWVDWWNKERLHSALGHVPPAEFDARSPEPQQLTDAA